MSERVYIGSFISQCQTFNHVCDFLLSIYYFYKNIFRQALLSGNFPTAETELREWKEDEVIQLFSPFHKCPSVFA